MDATNNKDGHNGDWRALYRAAIQEQESEKIAGRIADAYKAIRERRLQLWNEGSLETGERERLENACHYLELLRQVGEK